ncbi:E3 ubiquitin-protein ligase PUB23-like [Phalaenopsis equestris]|uniref:E3 ubiquitin-protein ligase PUB23-like n=1 Tax=Phalaenopsis equestris TaxID=78828 RepID=UPI0009E5DF36|nr:E3 ubiquitin-protein ligase PUB23-like [Phalaenopsis equestris]
MMTTKPELPSVFRCPISLELMENPVTISTGITYDRRSIEKWLFTYKKSTCPATMQLLSTFDLIPNHTLKNLILSWCTQHQHLSSLPSPSSPSSSQVHQLTSIFSTMESSPFKVNYLKKLRSFTSENHPVFISSGGMEALSCIITDCTDSSDFNSFRACEEALGVLNTLPFDYDDESVELFSKPDSINAILLILQRGSAEARLNAIALLQRISKLKSSLTDQLHQNNDAFKSLLDLLSDDTSSRLSSASLDLLLNALENSKSNRLKAIEAGAVRVLIELLPDAGRHKGQRTLFLLKRLCECAEGRSAFADYGFGVAAVSSKITAREFDAETKLGVKVLWLVCCFFPTKKVVDDMMICGAVKKLLGLIHGDDGRSTTKEKALKMMRMHGDVWRQSPCFPCELRALQY